MEVASNREGRETEMWWCIVEAKGQSLDLMPLCDINMKQHAKLAQVKGVFLLLLF